jgi:peptidoglycan/LPS O-acetylase OafA/YrhL
MVLASRVSFAAAAIGSWLRVTQNGSGVRDLPVRAAAARRHRRPRIGVNAILAGVIQIVMAVRLRKEIEGEWLLGLAGLVSILFGAFVVIFPGGGALALVWLIAAYAIVVGTILLVLALRLRKTRTSALAPT